jgi:ABC-type glycerol-3-phosphate transport system substrate-binding protein
MSDAYEIIMTSNNTVTAQKLFNYFHDLNDSEYIDISSDWWYEDAIMETSVDNYNYRFLYGDINILDMGVAGTIYYNKDLYEQYLSTNKNADELYNTVLEGKWTLEEFTRLTKKSHIEKGGDGSNDIHGYSLFRGAEPIHFFREAAGIKMYERNDQGMPIFTLNDERSVEFANKLYKMLYENEGAWLFYPGQTGMEEVHSYDFSNGKVIFYIGILNDTLGEGLHVTLKEGLREMKSDFGMLPYPKFDEAQEEYISFMHNASVMTDCPVSADIDRVNEELSAVIEALASESYRSVTIPYYENALKAAYNRDDLSAQMIDIITGQHDTIKSTLTKNFVYEYTSSLGNIGVIFSNLMDEKSTNFVSMYDSRIGAAEIGLKDLIKQYKDGKL